MVSFSAIKPGDVLYQVKRPKMGNTTMSRDVVYQVRVVGVHDTWALCSWNSNPPKRWNSYSFGPLRRTPPKVRESIFDMAARAAILKTKDTTHG